MVNRHRFPPCVACNEIRDEPKKTRMALCRASSFHPVPDIPHTVSCLVDRVILRSLRLPLPDDERRGNGTENSDSVDSV
ncbi:MAG TPA: hypothetical protein VFY65_04170, partial [Longimicrobium sp.]|nr:hypothetical protein [Longimicrobium sp.]